MTTARDLIERAMRDIGELGQGQSASGNDIADGLSLLNDLVSTWNNDSLSIYAIVETAHTLTGAASYTIGAGGNINVTRPRKVEAANLRQGSSDIPILVTNDPQEWIKVADKTVAGSVPELLYYEQSYPLGRIYLSPYGTSGDSLRLWLWTQLSSFATANANVSLPPGYEPALRFNLATWLCPMFGKEAPSRIDRLAYTSKRAIQRTNFKPPRLTVEHPSARREADILSGD